MAEERKVYIEYRFHSGLVLSGFVDQELAGSFLRNNVAPSVPNAESTPLFGHNKAVLLQDQRVVSFSTVVSGAAYDFHHQGKR